MILFFFHGPCVTWFEATMNDESAKLQAELTSSDFEQALGLAQDKVGFVKAGMLFLGEKTGLWPSHAMFRFEIWGEVLYEKLRTVSWPKCFCESMYMLCRPRFAHMPPWAGEVREIFQNFEIRLTSRDSLEKWAWRIEVVLRKSQRGCWGKVGSVRALPESVQQNHAK